MHDEYILCLPLWCWYNDICVRILLNIVNWLVLQSVWVWPMFNSVTKSAQTVASWVRAAIPDHWDSYTKIELSSFWEQPFTDLSQFLSSLDIQHSTSISRTYAICQGNLLWFPVPALFLELLGCNKWQIAWLFQKHCGSLIKFCRALHKS